MLDVRNFQPFTRWTWAVLLAGAMALSLAMAGVSPSPAAASVQCTGSSISGAGSGLQGIAQQVVWAPAFSSEICNEGTFPKVSYSATNSAAGMAAWNYDGELGEIDDGVAFVGTDMPPTATQLSNIESVAGGGRVAVIPAAETAIAIVANPPEGCLVEGITNSQLASAFEGRTFSWAQLETAEGEGACEAPITRVVRKDPSGTAYQFKNYLFQLSGEGLFCTTGGTEGKASWQELQTVTEASTGAPNSSWPETCAKKALSAISRPSAGGETEEVNKVNATAGSIGFAALPEAEANAAGTTVILPLQNNGQKKGGEANFAEAAAGSQANCGSISYKVPKTTGGLDYDWSGVYGAHPGIGGLSYPLCTLTYALAFHGYQAAGFSEGQEITANDYLNGYLVQSTGQAAIKSHYYDALPSSPEGLFDVLGAARRAAKEISY